MGFGKRLLFLFFHFLDLLEALFGSRIYCHITTTTTYCNTTNRGWAMTGKALSVSHSLELYLFLTQVICRMSWLVLKQVSCSDHPCTCGAGRP